MQRISFLMWLVVISATCFGQKQKEISADEVRAKFPDKQAVFLFKKEVVQITLDKNDSIITTVNYSSEMLHLQERTEGLAESSVNFSDFVDITSLDAKTLVPNKKSFKQVKVSQFQIQNPKSGGIFFDDSKLKTFNYPGVQPGAKTLLTYSQKYKEPRLLSPYYFTSYVPVLESTVEIHVDKRIKLGYKLFNRNAKINFSESSDGNFNIYRWTAGNLTEYTIEDNAPSISYSEPHLIYFIEEVNAKNKKEVFLKGTSELYRWYYSIALKEQQPVSGELKAIIDSLIAGAKTDQEKTKRIFYWVQDHVKYVAFEEGYGGFIPRDANLVCDRRYGDCKDMANLLVQMLRYAGVKAYHVWIGTRDIPYSYHELPAPNVDNHMIAAALLDGNYVFLDATSKYTKLGLPSSMIQGKEALIGIDKDHYEIVKVPVIPAKENRIVDSVLCSIDNNVLKGIGRITVEGFNKIDFTYYYNYKKADAQKEYIKDVSNKGSNKYILKKYTLKNIEEKEKPIILDYEFMVEDYVKVSGNEIYINLNLDKTHDKSKIDTLKRKLAFEYDYKYTLEDAVTLNVPAGYVVDYLPDNVTLSSDIFDFTITYKYDKVKNQILYSKKSVLNTLMIESKDFNEWNKLAAKISQAYREVVVLKQVK